MKPFTSSIGRRRTLAVLCVLLWLGLESVHQLDAQALAWTYRFSDPSLRLNSVVWTGAQFAAVGAELYTRVDQYGSWREVSSACVLTSPDGLNWTRRTNGVGSAELLRVTWTGTQLVAVSSDWAFAQSSVAISNDGINWTSPAQSVPGGFEDIVWTGSRFVALGPGTGNGVGGQTSIWHSTNGTQWTEYATPEDTGPLKLCWTGSQVVVVGRHYLVETKPDGFGGTYKSYTPIGASVFNSSDGVTWTEQTINTGFSSFQSVCFNGSQLMAADSYSGYWTSADGVSWSKKAGAHYMDIVWTGQHFAGIAYGGGYYGAAQKHFVDLSGNGTTWTRQSQAMPAGTGTLPLVTTVAFNGSRIVSVAGEVWQSVQGTAIFSAEVPAPAAPTLVAPGTTTAPGPSLTSLTPQLSWSAVSGVSGYAVAITDLVTGAVAYSNNTIGPVTAFAVPEGHLLAGHAYAWRLRSRMGTRVSAESAPRYFTIPENVAVPPTPVLVAPGLAKAPGSTLTVLPAAFSWKASAGALGYGLYIADAVTGTLVYESETIGKVTSHPPPAGTLQNGRAYRWNMRARNAAGWSSYSARLHFQTPAGVVLPGVPVVVAPGSTTSPGSVITGVGALAPLFKWNAVPNAAGYGLYIADAATGQIVYDEEGIGTETSHQLPAGILFWGKQYRWNMRARIASGWSGFSARRYFQTASDFPTPTVSSFDPPALIGSDVRQPLVIIGSGFRTGAKVLLTWKGKTDYVVPAAQTFLESDTRIRVLITTTQIADTWNAKVQNTDLKTSAPPVDFQVFAPGPGIIPIPTASPLPTTHTQPVLVTFNEPSPGEEIRYTLNGTEPSALSPLYTNPFLLGAT